MMCVATAACTKKIEFNGSETESKIVVNGVERAGQKAMIQISKSSFFLDNNVSTYDGEDATVKLYINDQYVENMTYTTYSDPSSYTTNSYGYFTSDTTLHEGDKVRFEVIVPGMETATAETVIPNSIPISLLSKQTAIKNTYGEAFPYYFEDADITVIYTGDTVHKDTPYEATVDFKLTFSDNGSEKNFYNIGFDTYNVFTKDIIFTEDGIFDQILVDDRDETYLSETNNVFNDNYFNGKECTLKFSKNYICIETDEITCSFMQIDDGYYNFVRTSNNYTNDEIYSLFMEPTRVYSNIENGIGAVIGCSAVSNITINLKEE